MAYRQSAYSVQEELEHVITEIHRVFEFQVRPEDRNLTPTEQLEKLLPMLKQMDGVAAADDVKELEEKIESNAEEIEALHKLIELEEAKSRAREEPEASARASPAGTVDKGQGTASEVKAQGGSTSATTGGSPTDRIALPAENNLAPLRIEDIKEPSEEDVALILKRLEGLPRDLTRLRKDLIQAEDELQKERFHQKELIRSIERAEGAKRRAQQMTQILQKEVERMEAKECEAEKEAQKPWPSRVQKPEVNARDMARQQVAEALAAAEDEFENCRREASASTKNHLQQMEELYDIQDDLLSEIKKHNEQKLVKQANRMKSMLSTFGRRDQQRSTSNSEVSESRRRVQELSRILSEKEERTKALEIKVDMLKQEVDSTERHLELARQERVMNARSLGEEASENFASGRASDSDPSTVDDFKWMN